jgi:hypothetical protein
MPSQRRKLFIEYGGVEFEIGGRLGTVGGIFRQPQRRRNGGRGIAGIFPDPASVAAERVASQDSYLLSIVSWKIRHDLAHRHRRNRWIGRSSEGYHEQCQRNAAANCGISLDPK